MDLADLELDVTHNLVLDLDVGVGHIHMQLCITGTANQQSSSANGHVMDSQQSHEETNWEQIIKKYVSIYIVNLWIHFPVSLFVDVFLPKCPYIY